jgi:hypothetical protein
MAEMSLQVSRVSVQVSRVSLQVPRVSVQVSRVSVQVSRVSVQVSRVSVQVPRSSVQVSRASVQVTATRALVTKGLVPPIPVTSAMTLMASPVACPAHRRPKEEGSGKSAPHATDVGHFRPLHTTMKKVYRPEHEELHSKCNASPRGLTPCRSRR